MNTNIDATAKTSKAHNIDNIVIQAAVFRQVALKQGTISRFSCTKICIW